MSQFVCHYRFLDRSHATGIPELAPNNGLLNFVEGFWLNVDLEYEWRREHQLYWIPPHNIEYIQRVPDPVPPPA